jgi:ubiquinone/menaquinone biosynthesis C-methylase UbiE
MSATVKKSRKPYLPAMGHDRLLPLYDPLQRLLGMESVHRQLVDQARIQPEQRLLEIGCGTGNLGRFESRLIVGTRSLWGRGGRGREGCPWS